VTINNTQLTRHHGETSSCRIYKMIRQRTCALSLSKLSAQ